MAEVGWDVSFHILLSSKPGMGAGEAGTGAVRGRGVHSPVPQPPPCPCPSPNFHSVRQPWQLIQEPSPLPSPPTRSWETGKEDRLPRSLGWGSRRVQGGWEGPRGRGRGISPHACLGLLPSPSPARLGGGTAGGIPSRCEPGPGVLGRGGGEEGNGWDQGRSCLPPQTPAAPACPGLSVHPSSLSGG